MNSKSRMALMFTIRYIIDNAMDPVLWTFTTRERLPYRQVMRIWRDSARDLCRSFGWQSVRVAELHPQGHGIHIHAVTPFRYDVRRVRQIAQNHGFGRIHCVSLDRRSDRIGAYLSKYLTKSAAISKGLRLWGVNGGIDFVRNTDITVQSVWQDLYRSYRVQFPNEPWFQTAVRTDRALCFGVN